MVVKGTVHHLRIMYKTFTCLFIYSLTYKEEVSPVLRWVLEYSFSVNNKDFTVTITWRFFGLFDR